MKKSIVKINTDFIKMDQLVKFAGIAETGGQAKEIIMSKKCYYNGELCCMRGKKFYPGDVLRVYDIEIEVSKTNKPYNLTQNIVEEEIM